VLTVTERGKFIVFEGLDGCGKTTQLLLLSERLKRAGVPHIATREPSDGNPVGRLVRDAVHGSVTLENETLALLFAADRYQHIQTEILPALTRGAHVLCDRYYYSNLAYQHDERSGKNTQASAPPVEYIRESSRTGGLTRHDARPGDTPDMRKTQDNYAPNHFREDYARLLAYNQAAINSCRPDAVFFFDTQPEECMRRLTARQTEAAGIYEKLDVLRQVRRRYMEILGSLSTGEDIHIIDDAGLTENEVGEILFRRIGKYLYSKTI
jgi:dTMP kinase